MSVAISTVLHAGVWISFKAIALSFRCTFKAACSLLGRTQEPPPRRLRPASGESMAELLQTLPRVTLPETLLSHPVALSFAPCSNLCLYMFGAAACLQRATNFEDAKPGLCYRGVSSGSVVAAVLAVNADVPDLFERCLGLLDAINVRRWGWIGAYSATIREIVRRAASGKKVSLETAGGKLSVGTTVLSPWPCFHEVTAFESSFSLQQAVLASCFIPVVWEDSVWLQGVGPCLDGGASGFMVNGDIVVSPYHSNLPEVGPPVEYPRQLVFQPIDAGDMLRLFEDGYRDCAQWIDAGCPSRRDERQRAIDSMGGGGIAALLREGWSTLLEVSGVRQKRS